MEIINGEVKPVDERPVLPGVMQAWESNRYYLRSLARKLEA